MTYTAYPSNTGRIVADRDDETLLAALRDGDQRVFGEVVDSWSGAMLRLALTYVDNRAAAEDVVQEAWLTVLRSLDRFERRSALKTWVLGIVVNIARSRARAERRTVSLTSETAGLSADPARFLPADHPRWPHHWATEPMSWRTPEADLLAAETVAILTGAIDALPPMQRDVLVLRDIEGLAAADVCNILSLTDTNQRVLLHRARSRVRATLERYLAAREKL